MVDSNINILNCNPDNETSDFIDTMYASSLYPTINTPTWITATSNTLIDNIFYKTLTKNTLAGNVATSISDHLIQFLITISVAKNYRTNSVLSSISKLIEKLLHNHLYSFLAQDIGLFNYQFGFRNNHSTNNALISIAEKFGKFACGVFLDFQRAFDTVNHQILISKPEHYRVRDVPLNLFKSYLEKQKQFVSVNNINSDILPIEYGLAQGSVLGLLFFLIYINDLNNAA